MYLTRYLIRAAARSASLCQYQPIITAHPSNSHRSVVSKHLATSSSTVQGGRKFLTSFVEELEKRGFKEGLDIDKQNVFDLFKLDHTFTINESKLRREYTNIQRSIHPDKFVNSDPVTQDRATNLAMFVNYAYETLKHPYKRARYLLSVKLNESQDELDKKLDAIKLDDEFLSRMMEMREEVELGSDEILLARIAGEVEDDLIALMIAMNKNFKNNETDALIEQLARLKFLGNLHVKLAERQESFSQF